MTRWWPLTHAIALAAGTALALQLLPHTSDCPVPKPEVSRPTPPPVARLPLPPLLAQAAPSPRAASRIVDAGAPGTAAEEPTDKGDFTGPAEDAAEILRRERTAQASATRASLVAAADPSAEQLARIDQVLADMNADLDAATQEIEARHADGSSADRREILAWTATALDILVTAEDGLNEALTPQQLAAVPPEALDPLAYVQAVQEE